MNFTDKVVLITGAGSGIGAATAVLFAKLGADLSLTGRNLTNLNNIAKKCEINSKKPFVIAGDLTKEEDVSAIIAETIKHYGRLDVLINNAAALALGGIENKSLTEYDNIMSTNVRAVYQLTMLAVPHLIQTKGNIVNVSSVAGLRAFPGCLAYCMSKSALDQMTRCTALELASKQVRVNSVNPGVIVTGLQKTAGMDDEACKAMLEHAKQTHPLQRPGEPEEVADAICFLASNLASNITGVTMPVDGGFNVMCPR